MPSLDTKNVALICVCIFAGCLLISDNVNGEKDIPVTKFGQSGPTMTFLYCYSCGYRKAFDDYVHILNEKYPDIQVTGANYEPPGMNLYLSKLIFWLKIALVFIIVSSFDLFGYIGVQTPSWWNHILSNKLYACMMIFFLGNMIEGQLMSSGAFEITLNTVPVWSKLQTGRIPSPQELFQIIDNQLQFTEKIQENPDFVK